MGIKSFTHFSLEEREKIYLWKGQKKTNREISRLLGRSHTSIKRELQRNRTAGHQYVPCKAQEKADTRGKKQRQKAPLKDPETFVYVREHLRDYEWTPEQIAGRLPLERPGLSITAETIYAYIYSKGAKRYKLWEHLPNHRVKRVTRTGRKVHKKGSIKNAKSIELRSKTVDKRSRLGDWESDVVHGKQSDTSALNVEHERVSRYTMLNKLPNKSSKAKATVQIQRYGELPTRVKKTITYDNGLENSQHEKVAAETNLDAYFTHAYASWEKGGIENTNKRVRRFIPKGRSLDPITDDQIAYIEKRMNNTPRKCLGYLTPYERIYQKAVTELPPPN